MREYSLHRVPAWLPGVQALRSNGGYAQADRSYCVPQEEANMQLRTHAIELSNVSQFVALTSRCVSLLPSQCGPQVSLPLAIYRD